MKAIQLPLNYWKSANKTVRNEGNLSTSYLKFYELKKALVTETALNE